jgi:hypothetical protein
VDIGIDISLCFSPLKHSSWSSNYHLLIPNGPLGAVTNFQNIRSELSEEMSHLEVQYKADMFKQQIIQRSASMYSNPMLFLNSFPVSFP